jgi:arylsulfatase A-like enzyme
MFVGDMACWWLNNYPKTEPLCMQIGFPGPHPPYDPIKRYADIYMDKKIDIDPIHSEDLKNQPLAYKIYREHCFEVDHDSVTHYPEIELKNRFRQRAFYCANISMIDEKIGEILKTLENQEYLSNTIIAFTSDHGDCLGDHGHSQKWTSYEQIVNVPMIIWGPGCGIPKGKICDSLCQQFDISHMLLDICGTNLHDSYESISAIPLLKNNKWEGREVVFAEQSKDGNFTGADFTTMVRTDNWKLTHFLGESDGQLHDLKNDPREISNLWNDKEYKYVKNELMDQLLEWRMYSQLNCSDLMAEIR